MLVYAVLLVKMQRYFDKLSYTNSEASQVAQWLRTCLPVQEMQEAQGSIPGLRQSPGRGNGVSNTRSIILA